MKPKNAIHNLADFYLECKKINNLPKEFYKKNKISYGRICRGAKLLVEACKGDDSEAFRTIYDASRKAKDMDCNWTMETVLKWKQKRKI